MDFLALLGFLIAFLSALEIDGFWLAYFLIIV
jgi:hypothetical protein